MTVSSTTNRKTFTGDDATTSFATTPVVFFDSSDLFVYVTVVATGATTLLTETTDYTVSGGDTSVGATGTVDTSGVGQYGALPTGSKLTILRDLPLTQGIDFVQNDASDADVSEAGLDKSVMREQRLSELIARSWQLPDGDVTGVSMTMPALASRASKYMGWDATGAPVALDGSDGTTGALAVALAASSGSSLVGFVQSGIGAITTETVQAALRRLVFLGQYSSAANFDTARDALTGTVGLPPKIEVTHSLDGDDYPFTIKTANTEAADFNMAVGDTVFNGTRDSTLHFGYNIASGGGRRDATEAAYAISFESNFNTGSSNLMEFHVQGIHVSDGTSFRPLSITVDRASKDTVGTIGVSQLNIMDRTLANQAFHFIPSSTTGVMFINGTSNIKVAVNNSPFLYQINAAGNLNIELLRLNASDVVYLAPGGGGVRIHSTLTLGDSASPQLLFSQSSGGTKVAQIYEQGDVLYVAEQGSGNRVSFDIAGGAIKSCAAQAIPAGGTAGLGIMMSSTANFGVFFGSGAPTLSAAKGSLYLRSDGTGTGDRAYINTNGSTTWTALTTAA